MTSQISIREILPEECEELGKLLVEVYSQLEGFPGLDDQPSYYKMLENIGLFRHRKRTKILVAISADNELLGGVVYFGDMSEYGSGGIATSIQNASGFRLLGVSPRARGLGVGKKLTMACIDQARQEKNSEVILHTTKSMQVAWSLYEKIGFIRSKELDFFQEELAVFGFRLKL